MTSPLFLTDFDDARVGAVVRVEGEEARHAEVKRIELGETVLVANGRGLGIEGPVVEAGKGWFAVEAERVLEAPQRRRVTAVQALAKGDRAMLAVQMLTEMGADRIVAWESERSIVRWSGDRGEKSLAKWASTARESAKQSRRLTVPDVVAATSKTLPSVLADVGTVLVLHEAATTHLKDVEITGDVAIVVGPEGGIAPTELARLEEAGAVAVRITDHVLRTSTAGAVALGQLEVL